MQILNISLLNIFIIQILVAHSHILYLYKRGGGGVAQRGDCVGYPLETFRDGLQQQKTTTN